MINYIEQFQREHGLTRGQGAALLAVPISTYNKWITGKRTPSSATLRLVNVLDQISVFAPDVFKLLRDESCNG